MYQGKNPTAITSQRLLLDSLIELLKTKDFKDITISELCCHSGVSRQTFYSLFGTKENILLYQIEQANNTKPSPENTDTVSITQTCENYSKYVASNYEHLSMLVGNELSEVLRVMIYNGMSSCNQSFVGLDDEEREYAALFMSSGLCSLTEKYIKSHKKPDKGELFRLSYKIMSGDIFKR